MPNFCEHCGDLLGRRRHELRLQQLRLEFDTGPAKKQGEEEFHGNRERRSVVEQDAVAQETGADAGQAATEQARPSRSTWSVRRTTSACVIPRVKESENVPHE